MSERCMVGPTRFEEYSEKYKDLFFMTRRDGILEVRMHTRGGPLQFDWAAQTAYGNVWILRVTVQVGRRDVLFALYIRRLERY